MNNPGAAILLVEDEPDLREMLTYSLSRASYRVTGAGDSQSAWSLLMDKPPDLVLLDWMLPGTSGIDLLRRMRREPGLKDIPVIMLTARGEEADRVIGLNTGADDYMVKPFSVNELIARIGAHLRRRDVVATDEALVACGIELDLASHRVQIDHQEIELGPTEFNLLKHFMLNQERVYSRSQLLDSVWGPSVYIEERTVDVHILRLRKALKTAGKSGCIQTVRGAGYRFSTI